ncbi:MAG: Gfo/Idh/MocA family oxidoreductase [Chitinophagaceae bacterium]|nr:Gfo/Idh/MocA family oxidoreductase [Chitinophagaceae bacterium]
MKNFVLIGAAGYVAPRHLKAIKETGNNLLAALDPHDSAGVLDHYFPKADFFTEFERFDRHCEKLKRNGAAIDYVTVCSPNYLHDAHIRFGFRIGADVICEKPVVLNPWNVDALLEMEKDTGKRVFSILQLRLHPAISQLRSKIQSTKDNKRYTIQINYITPRGKWYNYSWKGSVDKSGGITTNIGLHLFDLLLWLFGDVRQYSVQENKANKASGKLILEKADVEWSLGIDADMLPPEKKSLRQLIIDNEIIELSEGFEDLHTLSYQEILQGRGNTLIEAKRTIQLVHDIRNAKK